MLSSICVGDPGDPGHVPAQAEGGRVDDGVDAGLLQLGQPLDGVVDPFVLVAPHLGVVLQDLRRQHEDVLVGEHPAQIVGRDRTPRRLHRRGASFHGDLPQLGDRAIMPQPAHPPAKPILRGRVLSNQAGSGVLLHRASGL